MPDQAIVLRNIISNKSVHARFLNTLSLMELLGAQKLARLVPYLGHRTAFLEHVAEEFRHAYFLRSLAEKLCGNEVPNFSTFTLCAERESRNYINKLHLQICLLLKRAQLTADIKRRAYLLSTLAIETRALPLYRAYQKALQDAGIPLSVKSILSEEERHLAQINEELALDAALLPLIEGSVALENTLFTAWLAALNRDLDR